MLSCESWMLVKKAQIEKNDNQAMRTYLQSDDQAMRTYLQSEQCHSIDPLNLLNTSRGMFSHFLWYQLWHASHYVMLKSCTVLLDYSILFQIFCPGFQAALLSKVNCWEVFFLYTVNWITKTACLKIFQGNERF